MNIYVYTYTCTNICVYMCVYIHIYIHPKVNSKLDLDIENSSPQFRDLSAKERGHWGDPPTLLQSLLGSCSGGMDFLAPAASPINVPTEGLAVVAEEKPLGKETQWLAVGNHWVSYGSVKA